MMQPYNLNKSKTSSQGADKINVHYLAKFDLQGELKRSRSSFFRKMDGFIELKRSKGKKIPSQQIEANYLKKAYIDLTT